MKRVNRHRLSWSARAIWLLAGLVLFFWIGYEDRGLLSVLICSALLCLAGGLTLVERFETRRETSSRPMGILFLLYGSLIGAAVGPAAALLMLIKVGLHGHIRPDFGAADLLRVVLLSPAWTLAGGLAGLAAGLARTGRRRR
jgi:hypothetical protein